MFALNRNQSSAYPKKKNAKPWSRFDANESTVDSFSDMRSTICYAERNANQKIGSFQMSQEELGDVVIFNCDNKFLQTPFNDVKNMPDELVSHLKKQLNNQHDHIGDRVSRIFLGVLVQLIGGYRDAFKYQSDAKAFFCKEIFIESRPSHLRKFLQGMLQLQIFRQFIDERLAMLNNGMGLSDEFELETLKYHEKHPRRGKKLWSNVKDKVSFSALH